MDVHERARIEELESQVAQARAAAAAAAGGVGVVQSGTATLIAGTKTVVANITASSTIQATFRITSSGGGTPADTVKIAVPNRVIGAPGSFEVQAQTATDVINSDDISSFDWLVIG